MIKPPPKDFFQWLDVRLHDADLTDYALAQKAGITHSVISRARSGQQGIGYEAGIALAQALDIPSEIMLRKLELLPPPANKAHSAVVDEMLSVYPDLSEEDQEELLQLARLKLERKKRGARGKKAGT